MHSMADYVLTTDEIYRKEIFKAYHPVEITGGYHSLFVYSDVIYPTLIGDTCAPLLRVVEIPQNSKFGDQIVCTYPDTHYLPLLTNEFESIEIAIRNDTGQYMPFEYGRSIATLHFRKT